MVSFVTGTNGASLPLSLLRRLIEINSPLFQAAEQRSSANVAE